MTAELSCFFETVPDAFDGAVAAAAPGIADGHARMLVPWSRVPPGPVRRTRSAGGDGDLPADRRHVACRVDDPDGHRVGTRRAVGVGDVEAAAGPPSPKAQVTDPIADQRSDGVVIDIATARSATAVAGTATAPGVGGVTSWTV